MGKMFNRVKMTVSGTPGTGDITLNAASPGFQTFAAAGVSVGDVVSYTIEDGTAFEVGQGTYLSGAVLRRSVIQTSSNAGAAISATSSAVVFITATASDFQGSVSLTDQDVITWNAALSPYAAVTLGGNRSIIINNIQSGARYRLTLTQDVTGSRTVTWSTLIRWANDTAPTLSTSAGTSDVIEFTSDGVSLFGRLLTSYTAGPAVAANFAYAPGDWSTIPTLASMPSGGSISRAGQAMMYDSTGKLTYAPNNLLLNTATLSTQSVTTAAINYILSFKGTGSVALSGAYSGSLAGTGAANRVSLAFTSTAASLTLTVTGTVTEAQLEAVTYQTTPSTYVATTTAAYYGPRFDYDPVTLQPKGLLVEGTRTNLLTYSEQLDNAAWTKARSTVTPNATTSPDGTSSADKLIDDTTAANNHNASVVYSFTSNTTYAVSVYAKKSERLELLLQLPNSAFPVSAEATFNLDNGAIKSTGAGAISSSITNVGNGWYRCSVTAIADTTVSGPIVFYMGNGTSFSYNGDGTSGLFLWGAQLEAASFATSYIPTVASSVTRAAETFTISGYTNRLLEAYYIDQQTNVSSSIPETVVSSGAVTINPPTFGWVTSLRAYTNAYAGDIATPSWLSFSRTGNAMYYDSTGTLTWAPANMCPYSADIGSANWGSLNAGTGAAPTVTSNYSTAPDGTSTATRLQLNRGAGTTSSDYAFRRMPSTGVTGIVGRNYLLSFYVKATSGTQEVTFWLGGGTTPIYQTVTVTDTAWTRVSVIDAPVSAATLIPSIGKVGNQGTTATADVLVWGCQIENVTYQTTPRAYIPTTTAAVYGPRYDYDASTVPATPRGLLIEESRQNLCTYSENLGTSYTIGGLLAFGSGSTLNADTSPDGTINADLITEDTTTGLHRIFKTITSTANTAYSFSFYVKRASGTRNIYVNVGVGADLIFSKYNLGTGTVITSGSGGTGSLSSSSIEAVGNGYYRVKLSGVISTTGTAVIPQIQLSNTANTAADASYAGDGTSGIYLWGLQYEAGSFATSYIPTVASSVTRAADVPTLSGSALTATGAATGSAIVQTSLQMYQPKAFGLLGNYVNRRLLYNSGSNTALQTFNGTVVTNAVVPGWTSGPVRAAVGWDAIGFSTVGNNGTVATQGSVGSPQPMGTDTVIYLGLGSSAHVLNGWIASAAFYNQRLPDAILKQKSAINAPY